jgi:hypothetical protein
MENFKNIKIDEKGQTELNLDFNEKIQTNKIEEPKVIYNKEIPKIQEEVEDDFNLKDLSEEEIEEMKTNDPERYFEIIEKEIKKEEDKFNREMGQTEEKKYVEEENEAIDNDKEDAGWEYYGRFKK